MCTCDVNFAQHVNFEFYILTMVYIFYNILAFNLKCIDNQFLT